jgi:quercetin dioxygenase-like cupin family protein
MRTSPPCGGDSRYRRDPERPSARETAYRFASLDYPATERRFNGCHAEFLPVAPDKLRPHDHAGVEFIYVIQGTLSVHVNGEEHALQAGDSIYFDATAPYAYRRSGGRLCTAVVVTAS